MAKNIQDVLGYVPLTKMIRTTKSGIPDPLPAGFRSNPKKVIGDKSRYMQRTGQRRTARQVYYGADAYNTELKEISSRDVALLHFYESIRLPMLTYQTLRWPESYELQDLARQEVDEQCVQFKDRFENLEVATNVMVLTLGHIYFDVNGNLLPSSSGAFLDVDFGVPAGNQNQLNIDGAGNIIAASWATPSTDIPGHIRALKQRSIFQHGYEPMYAMYGVNIPSYFNANTALVNYLARNPVMRDKYLTSNELPAGLMDLTWIPGYKAFYEDANGVKQKLVADDAVILFPEVDANWWEWQAGSYLVPKTFDIVPEGPAARDNFEIVYGMFGYGQPVRNPVTADIYYGDTFLPVLKNPNV